MHRLRLTNEFPGETIYRSNLIKVNLDKKKQLLEVAYKNNHDLMVSTKKLHDCYVEIFKASDEFHSQRSVSSEYIAQHSEIRQLVQGITPVEFQIPNDAIQTLARILRKCQAYNTKLTEDLHQINYLISEHDIGFNISQCTEGQESGDEEKEIINQIVSETNRIITGNTSLSYYVLYLLPFNNGDYYKLGITNQKDLFRIKYLDDVYDINFDESAIFYGFKRDILLAEKYLKQYIPKVYDNPYDGMNGFSEVREIEYFDKTMEKCTNQFTIDFGFLKYKLKDLDIPEWKNSIKQRPKRKEEIQIDLPDIYLEVIDMPDNDSYF